MADKLRLSPEGIAQCVKACDELRDGLDELLSRVAELTQLPAPKDLVSAQQLMQGFVQKAQGGPASVYQRLVQFREVAIAMRKNFETGGEGFAETEARFAQVLGDVGKGMDA
ncbi:hypothetical protein [Speluncibacter jeojiensis]|uniref:Uncharacterized protein n=1 Tax=Speluncibacter jeojiensis TaxID=2710754 RepID=A0A9X4RD09_9ACTN|nr:hypothetical protein [Corynebacteriales bacterium D3-21]